MIPEPSVASAYIVEAGRLLMIRRVVPAGPLEWTTPAGWIEPGETPEEAAVREVAEEVGLTVEPVELLGDRVHPATGRHLIYIACRVVTGTPAVRAAGEITAVEWCSWETVQERWPGGLIFPAVREYLSRVLTPAGAG